jgi:ribosomal protein S14
MIPKTNKATILSLVPLRIPCVSVLVDATQTVSQKTHVRNSRTRTIEGCSRSGVKQAVKRRIAIVRIDQLAVKTAKGHCVARPPYAIVTRKVISRLI